MFVHARTPRFVKNFDLDMQDGSLQNPLNFYGELVCQCSGVTTVKNGGANQEICRSNFHFTTFNHNQDEFQS